MMKSTQHQLVGSFLEEQESKDVENQLIRLVHLVAPHKRLPKNDCPLTCLLT